MMKSISDANRWVARYAGAFLMALMLMIVVDFVSRGIYHPVPGIDAAAVFVAVFIGYLGLGHCEYRGSHVRVEMFVSKLPPKWARLLNQFSYCLAFSIVVLAIYAGGMSALWALKHGEAVAGPTPLPVSPIKILLTIGLVFYLLQLLVSLVGFFKRVEHSEKTIGRVRRTL